VITIAAWIAAGIALWLTRSVLDMFGDATHSTRVAMLPSAPELAGLVVMALLAAGAAAAIVNGWTRDASERSEARLQIALPLFALSVIAIPYMPVLPDLIPPLRLFAGPVVWIVWISVAGLVLMTALAARRSIQHRYQSTGGTRLVGTVVIFAGTLAIAGTTGIQLRDTLTYPSGEEPHYMIMMQSLWRDHDLKIQNNYDRKDYEEYFAPSLTPDQPSLGADGQIYSTRGIGLAVLGAPIFAWRGYHGLVWMFVVLAALAATVMWRWSFAHTGSGEAATLAWLAVFIAPPVLFTTIAVYPDIPAAFCVMVALAWRSNPQESKGTVQEYVIRAAAVAVLPWLSMTYAPMAAAIVAVLVLRAGASRKAAATVLAISTFSMVSWLAFFHHVWGRWSPMAPYGTEPIMGNAISGMMGLLFDQEFGVLAYAPAFMIGFAGLWKMASAHDQLTRTRGRELAAVFAVLLISVGALEAWWGEAALPGRPLVPALPLLGLPIAWAYQRASEFPIRRGVYQLVIFIGVSLSATMLFAQDGGLLVQDRDGSSRLLQWLTSLWPAWEAAPSVAAFGLRHSTPLIGLWLLATAAVSWVSGRGRVRSAGLGALSASVLVTLAAILIAILGPIVARPASAWVLQPESRSRLPMLDSFDAAARPHAIIYDRLTFTHAANIPPLMTLAASPGERPGAQPVPVLLNARYALAAGQYDVEIGGIPGGELARGTVALQVGRMGSPMLEWDADIPSGGSWRQRFSLPVDAEFVGFIASPSIASATSLRIRPVSIVDKSRREAIVHGATFNVLSAVAFPTASLFFHDEDVYAERTGVWVHGESTTTMTVAPQRPETGVTLRVHSGAAPNTAAFSTSTWGERVALAPGVPVEVHIPPPAKAGPFLLRVTTEHGFIPAEVIPGNADRRILGIWIEIQQ
jgi:hypothetical protein